MHTSGSSLASRLAWSGFGLAVVLGACVRDPLSADCPDVAPGELVVSELFKDTDAHAWIELYNPTDRALDLGGLRVTVLPLTGEIDKTWAFIVRGDEVRVEPGGYVVLGQGDPRFWDFFDYDFLDDNGSPPGPEGKLELHACGVVVDSLVYRGSIGDDAEPAEGPASFALDGRSPPSADANDDTDEHWCLDATPYQSAPDKQATVGSPGEANPPCSV